MSPNWKHQHRRREFEQRYEIQTGVRLADYREAYDRQCQAMLSDRSKKAADRAA